MSVCMFISFIAYSATFIAAPVMAMFMAPSVSEVTENAKELTFMEIYN